jgi:uncharacterized membrane protein (UPF0127 family)
VFLDELIRQPDLSWQLVNDRTDRIIATRLLTAFDSKSRNQGLLGRTSFEAGSALIIAPCNAVHTFFMRFDIDVVFVAKTGQVLKIQNALRPWRLAWGVRAFAAIELPAGTASSTDTLLEDRLVVREAAGGASTQPEPTLRREKSALWVPSRSKHNEATEI